MWPYCELQPMHRGCQPWRDEAEMGKYMASCFYLLHRVGWGRVGIQIRRLKNWSIFSCLNLMRRQKRLGNPKTKFGLLDHVKCEMLAAAVVVQVNKYLCHHKFTITSEVSFLFFFWIRIQNSAFKIILFPTADVKFVEAINNPAKILVLFLINHLVLIDNCGKNRQGFVEISLIERDSDGQNQIQMLMMGVILMMLVLEGSPKPKIPSAV